MDTRKIDALIEVAFFGKSFQEWDTYIDKEKGIMTTILGTPHYSTKMADAWLVVELMREKQFAFSMGQLKHMENPVRLEWIVKYDWHNPDYKFEFDSDKLAPMAICKASLKVLGVDVQND